MCPGISPNLMGVMHLLVGINNNDYNRGTKGFEEKNLSLQFEKDGRVPEKFEQGDELGVLSLSS